MKIFGMEIKSCDVLPVDVVIFDAEGALIHHKGNIFRANVKQANKLAEYIVLADMIKKKKTLEELENEKNAWNLLSDVCTGFYV